MGEGMLCQEYNVSVILDISILVNQFVFVIESKISHS